MERRHVVHLPEEERDVLSPIAHVKTGGGLSATGVLAQYLGRHFRRRKSARGSCALCSRRRARQEITVHPLLRQRDGRLPTPLFLSHCQSTRILFTEEVFPKAPYNIRNKGTPTLLLKTWTELGDILDTSKVTLQDFSNVPFSADKTTLTNGKWFRHAGDNVLSIYFAAVAKENPTVSLDIYRVTSRAFVFQENASNRARRMNPTFGESCIVGPLLPLYQIWSSTRSEFSQAQWTKAKGFLSSGRS